MIAIEIILHIVYSKNTGIYSGFCMCHILKDEDEDIYVIHPLLQVGPGRGGDHIYIYKSILIFKKCFFWARCIPPPTIWPANNQMIFQLPLPPPAPPESPTGVRLDLQQEMESERSSGLKNKRIPKGFPLGFRPQVDSVTGIYTLLETNSSHLKKHPWKRRFLLETIIFRCELLVSGRVTTYTWPIPTYTWPIPLSYNHRKTLRLPRITGCMLFEPCHLGHRNVLNDQPVDVHFHLSSKGTYFYSMDNKWVSQAITTRFHVRSKQLCFIVSHVLTSFCHGNIWKVDDIDV